MNHIDKKYTLSKKIRTFKPSSAECIKSLEEHVQCVRCLTLLSNDILVSGSRDCSIKFWNYRTGKCLDSLKAHDNGVRCLINNETHLYSGSRDNTIKVWDLNTLSCSSTLVGHEYFVSSLSFLPDPNLLASGSYDSTINIWDLRVFKHVLSIKDHTDGIRSLVFSDPTPTNNDQSITPYLISASFDRTICCWNPYNFTLEKIIDDNKYYIYSLYPLKNNYLVCATWKGLKIYSLSTFKHICSSNLHEDWVNDISFCDDYLVSCSDDRTIKVYTLHSNHSSSDENLSLDCIASLNGHQNSVSCIIGWPGYLGSGSMDNSVKIWGEL